MLAARLSASGDREVLLVEAGPDYPTPSSLAPDLADGRENSVKRHDWGYDHRPTTTVKVPFPFPRGRVVGGSSAVNTCIALRGQPWDYEEWASRGMPEWSWAHCLRNFKRLERDLDFGDHPDHGNDGPLPIRRHPRSELVGWQAAFLDAADRLGFPACEDSNRTGSWGAGPHAMNKIDGRRISAAEAWLTPDVRARTNLTIQADTLVRRVVFRGTQAVGVELEPSAGGKAVTVDADEVILSAGAVNTPGVLLRSGVGPRHQLSTLNVDVVAYNEAVNQQLLDHPGVAIFMRPRFRTLPSFRVNAPLIQNALRYGSKANNYNNDMLLQPGSRLIYMHHTVPFVSLMTAIGKPRGTGVLRYSSADPRSRPVITSNFLENPHDRGMAVEAMMLATELAATPPMRRIATHFWPSRRVLTNTRRTDKWVRTACDSGYHPSGTVPMGADDDASAATDPQGRVRGVTGLRVVDASLMPTIPSSNIHLATLMIAERIAEMMTAAPT